MTGRPELSGGTRPARPSVLLGSQLLFNLGFFAVMPFLTVTLRDDLALSETAIGMVLGARTFSQQGMFLVGGALADRFGARRLILVGCAVRVVGYLALGLADDLTSILVGAVLTGVGGALFSPGLETLVARADRAARPDRPASRPTLFAALAMVGEVGAAAGPLIGVALFDLGFAATVTLGAVLFSAVAVLLSVLLPRDEPPRRTGRDQSRRDRTRSLLPASLTDPRFLRFAAAYSVVLLAYNQMYLGLPLEVDRAGGSTSTIAALFLLLSVLTVTLQWPVALLARTIGPSRALPLGLGIIALGPAVVAWQVSVSPAGTAETGIPVLVVCLALGTMLASPVALELVPDFAGDRPLGSYYGLLASAGGCAVLAGNTALGALFTSTAGPGPSAALPWAALALLVLVAAATIPHQIPARDRRATDALTSTTGA